MKADSTKGRAKKAFQRSSNDNIILHWVDHLRTFVHENNVDSIRSFVPYLDQFDLLEGSDSLAIREGILQAPIDDKGNTLAMWLLQNDLTDLGSYVIDKTPYPLMVRNKSGENILHFAIRKCDDSTIYSLIARATREELRACGGSDQDTPLTLATRLNKTDTALLLIRRGEGFANGKGQSALQIAEALGNDEIRRAFEIKCGIHKAEAAQKDTPGFLFNPGKFNTQEISAALQAIPE